MDLQVARAHVKQSSCFYAHNNVEGPNPECQEQAARESSSWCELVNAT